MTTALTEQDRMMIDLLNNGEELDQVTCPKCEQFVPLHLRRCIDVPLRFRNETLLAAFVTCEDCQLAWGASVYSWHQAPILKDAVEALAKYDVLIQDVDTSEEISFELFDSIQRQRSQETRWSNKLLKLLIDAGVSVVASTCG